MPERLPRPGTVLMTTDTVGGVWHYSLELARGLAQNGVAVVLAAMGDPVDADQQRCAEKIPRLKLESRPCRLEWMPGSADDVSAAGRWLLSLARKHRPDLVHINGYAHASLPWKVPCLVVAHSCVLSWFWYVKRSHAPTEWSDYAVMVRKGLQAADMVIFPTTSLLSVFEQIYGHLPHARKIPNGRAPSRFKPGPKEPFIFTAGRFWDEAKNISAVEKAGASLPWPVIAAGECCKPLADTHPIGNLTYLGSLAPEAVAAHLSRASIYTLPARYEPFGLSVLEAALCGCAMVLGNIPFLRENWSGAALFVDPEDTKGLQKALERLIREPETRSRLAQKARTRALRLNETRMTAHYLKTYSELLQGTPEHTFRMPSLKGTRYEKERSCALFSSSIP
ncbi:MAG: glycosyltransferase family 4 protein [Desulfovibrionales bacterium]